MSSLSTQFEGLANQFRALDKKIRGVLILGALFLCYALMDTFLIQPMTTEYDNAVANIEKTIKSRKAIEKEISLVSNQLGIDPKLKDDDQLVALKEQIAKLDENIKTASAEFVTADEMIKFLNDLLVSSKNLELLSMEKLPLEFTILKTIDSPNKKTDSSGTKKNESMSEAKIFRHGVKFQLSGRYIEIVKYMQAVESLPWRIFWEASDLNTESYPNSIVSFEIYTLSLDENWLTL